MADLFKQAVVVSDPISRNIVRKPDKTHHPLAHKQETSLADIADELIGISRVELSSHLVERTFQQLAAIDYPFHHEPFDASRFSNGAFINLTDASYRSKLISRDYSFCQQVGRQLYDMGHNGVISCSARLNDERNINVLKAKVLSEPKLGEHLQYRVDINKMTVLVSHSSEKQ